MKATQATQLIGKVVRFDDGVSVLLVSGGVGNGCTFTFRKEHDEAPWIEMPMRESLPYVLELMKAMIDEH